MSTAPQYIRPQCDWLWLCLIALAATAAIAGVYLPLPELHYVAKPVATLLILAMVCTGPASEPGYRAGIVTGLVLSTAGDMFLMLRGDHFVMGLASFLCAHVSYLFAFTRRERLFSIRWPALVYALPATAAVLALAPRLPSGLLAPVIVYATLLAAMAAQAMVLWRRRRDRANAFAAAGGLLFVCSDSLLATETFVIAFAAGPLLVLTTYWLAQTLIGLSARRTSR